MTEIRIALCTAENEAKASMLAEQILQARLAACVNIVPGIQSMYWWQGKLERSGEVLMFIKTMADQVATLKDIVAQHHGYDTPELLVLEVSDGLSRYLEWVEKETRPL